MNQLTPLKIKNNFSAVDGQGKLWIKKEQLVADLATTTDRLQADLSRRDFKEAATDPTIGGLSAHEMLAIRIFFISAYMNFSFCANVYLHLTNI